MNKITNQEQLCFEDKNAEFFPFFPFSPFHIYFFFFFIMTQCDASEQDIIFISDDEIIVISDDDDDDDIFFTAPSSPTMQTTAVTTKPPILMGINDRLKTLRLSSEPSKPLVTNHTIPERASSRHRITKRPMDRDDARYIDRLSIGERVVFRKRHHDRYYCFDVSDTFESYTYDYTHVDYLPLSKDDCYEPYSAPWLRWKRRQYFESLIVVSFLFFL